MRCQRQMKREKHNPCETKARFFPPLLPVGSQEWVSKVPKRGQFHLAIRVTPKRCNSCAQGGTRETNGSATKLLRCGIASEALQRNMPLRSASRQHTSKLQRVSLDDRCWLPNKVTLFRHSLSKDIRLLGAYMFGVSCRSNLMCWYTRQL